MTRLPLAVLILGLGLAACSGVEELALNPEGRAPVETNNPVSAGSGGKSGEAGSFSMATGAAGNSHGGGGQASAQGGALTVPCINNDSCQSDTAPYCRTDGFCVACLTDDHCSDDRKCDDESSTCTGGDTLEGIGGEKASGGDGP